MRDIELYRHLLGIENPWTVTRVELNVADQRVDVWAGHEERAPWTCPECGASAPVYDHAEERVWRHLDSCQFRTLLHARPPRVQCPTHGVRQVRLPWAEGRARFTTLFERLAIEVLRECDITGACAILRISWDEAWHVLERAVRRGRQRKARRLPARLGVDEKAVAKGHVYMTLVCDLEAATIEHVAEERKRASLEQYFEQFTAEERAAIKAIAMDMWAPYEDAVRAQVPQADDRIVFDLFHIMQHMNEAVDRTRRHEHRELKGVGDDRLMGTKYVWSYGEENVPDKRLARLTARGMMRKLKTTRAWSIKESLRDLWKCRSRGGGTPLALVVRLGHPQPPESCEEGGGHAQGTSPGRARVLPPPSDQRGQRGVETRRFSGSRKWPTASATASTSRPRSSSIAGASISTRLPTENPEEPTDQPAMSPSRR